ncbi:MAG: RagB/SusD family nutrient uptake outer membrane protein [Alistipes sp.]|nr:RagB/SusD family nutrient uptake outer membrane protein [Alistipes sp.]
MKKIVLMIAAAGMMTGCIKEFTPQTSYASVDQVNDAPGVFENYVNAISNALTMDVFDAESRAYDFGYPALMIERDVMGQDIAFRDVNDTNWFTSWYTADAYLGPLYIYSQIPWSYYYRYIKNCNVAISAAGENPSEEKHAGAGIAYAMRALFYMELAQIYAPKTYTLDSQSPTVPILTESTTVEQARNNPRATNEEMFKFILEDLNKAETYLADYTRKDKTTPDLSVVYGLKARAYLLMGEWANAKEYAKKAQVGYSMLTEAQYLDRDNGFNTPNDAWMLAVTYKPTDNCIIVNDADTSWGSWMIIEINPNTSGCGYASNYGVPCNIDRHLYETINDSDWRKKCFVDFAIDDMEDEEALEALRAYTDHPDWLLYATAGSYVEIVDTEQAVGGLSLKFRPGNGDAGRNNQYIGFCVSVPMMRVEEMYLIEAEAAGMLNEAEGISLLTAFAKTRDAEYSYPTYLEKYHNNETSTFQNECWWQRRIELWGEGMATFDIKRLNKGIFRSYPGTNHGDQYQWNTSSAPGWMNYCIVQTETNYNTACTNNPTPIPPVGNSDQAETW